MIDTARDVPAGFVAYWTEDEDWTTDRAVIGGRRCRWGAGYYRRACGAPAVAALRRRNGWWCYCGDHLYGRRLVGDAVQVSRLREAGS